ncbi:putative thioesterase involved in non-ribosomal peptide biosynthesis [Desulfosporosinus youngiae DSM 17734]|uniref:Putative thioesterase involved in non-ribosomal peptide biosynthesis n=2 Tax=Desulfosporosinus TaxID=79206 RepID=H5XU23_9FIRM|nr:putative thioesterase involved in non-ribosomal peptide biosynthesis [Desulfosporosinus youngiae DSM 17734]
MMTKWINHASENKGAKINLFCFPHAGGSSSYFARWSRNFSEAINIFPVEYPMREKRSGEAMPDSLTELARQMSVECRDMFSAPFALFGHCTGAIIAYEAAQALYEKFQIEPLSLFVSASVSPRYTKIQSVQAMGDEEFIAFVGKYGAVDPVFLENKELLDYFLPIVRKDFELHENYRPGMHPPLTCPIHALNGNHDFNTLASAEVDDWAVFTTAAFKKDVFPGEHFYLDSHLQEICRLLETTLLELG